MIAIIAGKETADTEAVQYALLHAGFATRRLASPDRAEDLVNEEGCKNCVVAIDARRLAEGSGSRTWASFLNDHPALGAVVTAWSHPDEAAQKATSEANRTIVENPFDAAAVVAGLRKAVSASARREASPMTRVARPASGATANDRAGGR